MSAIGSQPATSERDRGTLTLDLRRCGGAVLETDGITNQVSEFAFHLLADTLRDRHGSYAARLGAADDAMRTVAILVQEL